MRRPGSAPPPPGGAPGAHRVACWDDELVPDLSGATDWDVAVRYADFGMPLARGTMHEARVRRLRAAAADAILSRARGVLGSVVHRTRRGCGPSTEVPPHAERVDVAVEETLDEAALAVASRTPLLPEDVHLEWEARRARGLVLCLDTSLSMQGEKLALMAVAVAVVLLTFPDDPVGVLGFDDEARVLRAPDEPLAPHALVERLLDVPGRPYTNLEAGLRRALAMAHEARARAGGRPASVVLVTDGKYTAGADPAPLGAGFDHLVVLKVGADRSGLPLCRDLAARGHGSVRKAEDLESLPMAMYRAVQELIRGRA